ncbi:MAG: hypothetical protein RIT38_281 [Bacteroidota bacterium]|jgi:hypothetical protein
MDYCTSHFGKPLSELTFEVIEEYFSTEREETDELEFKSIPAIKQLEDGYDKIKQACCALLNSSGGIIIWGAPVEVNEKDRKKKKVSGGLTFTDKTINKDQVVNKLTDSIIPTPKDIRIKILSKADRSILLFEIDQSQYAPHQYNNTYFMRIDGQTKPAPHHYIEALFKKIKFPEIEAYLKVGSLDLIMINGSRNVKLKFNLCFFNWTPYQNEEKLYYRIVTNGKFIKSTDPNYVHRYKMNGREYYNHNVKDVFYSMEPVTESDVIHFNINEIKKEGVDAWILISFGGKYSPLKFCNYKLDLSHLTPDKFIIEKEENVFTHKKYTNKSRQDIMNEIFKDLE